MIRIFKVFSILLILLMLVGNSDVVHAQEYYFAVETQTMEVPRCAMTSSPREIFDFMGRGPGRPLGVAPTGS